mmetsp:Transcript_32898/g.57503  ORF Transcript_32898/g.57503 Transcript_32898/m.57503 type:complete len:108 (-) Transcript_32898:205-528(-)
MGIDCVSISSGREAIKTIVHDKEVFDLMFLDYEMPDLNGPQTARLLYQMLNSGEVDELPVIVAYTAYSSDRDMQECKASGMNEFLSKPCSVSEVSRIVLKYCTKYRA